MENKLMNLKVLLPYKVFADVKNVCRIVVETNDGYNGFLPNRLACVAALVPGIFTYETTSGNEQYIAIDEGILVKKGFQVLISVRNAVGGTDLGKLHVLVESEFKKIDHNEKIVQSAVAKMERGFIHSFQKFRREQ